MRTRIFVAGMAALAIAGSTIAPVSALAQTSSLDAVTALLKQIQDLQVRIAELQRQQVELRKQQGEQIGQLVKTLKEGSQGDEVKILQALLAADLEVYPEGRITGFFGPLTAKAVKRFQGKHGIEQLGVVGPKTLAKINEKLSAMPVALEDDDDDDDDDDNDRSEKRICAKVPPGHLIAPGWLKKHDGIRPLVPECQKLPPGIAKKLPPPAATSTPPAPTPTPPPPAPSDTTPPTISSIQVSNIASSSAIVNWTTNEPATSKVYYGTVSPLNLATSTSASNSVTVLFHGLPLSGLQATTTYHYVIESRDAVGNTATSSQQSFITVQ